IILAKRSLDPSLLAQSFEFFNMAVNWGSWNKEDRLVGSTVLASLPGNLQTVRTDFERLRIALESHGILPEDRIFAAAAMADLDPSWWDLVFSRIDEIHRRRPPLNAILLSALARSPYSVDEALARFDAALAGMATRCYKDGLVVEAAASIPPIPVPLAAVPLYGPSWYAWHTYWVYRPLGRYIATHPVHVHTIAAFG